MRDEDHPTVSIAKQPSFLSIMDILKTKSHSGRGQVMDTEEKRTFSSEPMLEPAILSKYERKSQCNNRVDLNEVNAKPHVETDRIKNLDSDPTRISGFKDWHWKCLQLQRHSACARIENNSLYDNILNNHSNDISGLPRLQSKILWESPLWQNYLNWARLEWSKVLMGRSSVLQMEPVIVEQSGSCSSVDWQSDQAQRKQVLWNLSPNLFHTEITEPQTRRNHKKPSQAGPATRVRRQRQAYSVSQLKVLEDEFTVSHYLRSERREILSQTLGLTENQIKAWFQNRRTKYKRQRTLQQPSESGPSTSGQNIALTDAETNIFLTSLLQSQ